MSKVIIACIGGFLGAGKTTAMLGAAAEISRRGKRVGIITNDQGQGLVDTHLARQQGLPSEEIAGGCFCCKFDDLVAAARTILEREQPQVILAEAVGSCTDLSATVYQPLRRYYSEQYDLAPLSVVVEPGRLSSPFSRHSDGFTEETRYLFERQLAEADVLLLNKIDTLQAGERQVVEGRLRRIAGDVPLLALSARTGEGIAEWVDALLAESRGGQRVLDIDYDRYANAEAALGWLNAAAEVEAEGAFPPQEFAASFLRSVRDGARASNFGVAHVKAMVLAGAASDRIALTDNDSEPLWSGMGQFEPVRNLSLVINARLRAAPDDLSKLVQESLAASAKAFRATVVVQQQECFSPGRPEPQHRFAQAVP